MRLIDADELTEDMDMAIDDAPIYIQATVSQHIDCAPTIDAIHAAGGCRCGECKHRNDHGHCAHPRHEILPTTYPNDFCSYGEPKEAQDDGQETV